jgi:hypothetical protein
MYVIEKRNSAERQYEEGGNCGPQLLEHPRSP